MSSIMLSGANAVVDLVNSVNANGTTTTGNDTITSTGAKLVGSIIDGSTGSDTLRITGGGTATMGAGEIGRAHV